MPPSKAATISVETLARSVESAVRIAAARHKLTVDKSTIIDRWEIVGRRLRDVKDMNVAFAFAADVARGIKVPGIKVEPIVSRIGRDIWVGFIDRGRLMKTISR